METKEKLNGKAVNINQPVKGANPVTEENKNPKFVAGNTVNKESVKTESTLEAEKAKETPKAEAPKTEAAKTEAPKAQEQTKPHAEQVKTEQKPEPAKPTLNLEGTLKLVEELHRRKVQRDKLINTINNLESFEIAIKEEADETAGNNYQRCELTIEDDKGNEFVTKNPVIIQAVAQYVNYLCVNRLAEVEAGIVINS